MKSEQVKRPVNKKVLVVATILIAWPPVALFIAMSSLYSLVGMNISESEASSRAAQAEVWIKFTFIAGFLSSISGIVLIDKKLRS